jgi:hypothetical protein
MENARHGRALEDVTYALGCCLRAVACLCQVLFAVNRTYLNEKGAVLGTQRLPFGPAASARESPAAFARRAPAIPPRPSKS